MDYSTLINSGQLRRAAMIARYATVLLFVMSYLSTHTPVNVPFTGAHGDKLIHMWAYMALSFALATSWELTRGPMQLVHYVWVWLIVVFYGAFDEITQIPVGRHCDIVDWVFDVVGVVVGLSLFYVCRPIVYRLAMLLSPPARQQS